MEKNALKPFSVRWLTRTALLLAVTLVFQMFGFPQMVTGPAVNAMLMISGIYVGPLGGIIIGLLTPWIAFMRGTLAPPLAPMIPFIMLGNAVIVILWVLFRVLIKNVYIGSIAGMVIGAVAKFLILSTAVRLIVSVPPPIAQAMQIPQLYTALLGGVIALVVDRLISVAFRNYNED
ncbi:ECF transporter S component [Calorimonas adulescens]|uniref:ECF transporter S component n=1 Tax=Calorimonas adulescens TaxID=2606906 RepID=A0A5D8QC85_9THEO|nr:ECF transporter S component [Calorimonas adulescens]TZE81153.1 ECF transporter S component [Calorimonas adulescens]